MTEAGVAKPQRPIRSYVLRQGRMTGGQQRAFSELWPVYGLTPTEVKLDLPGLFGNNHPVTLEIGFGNGEALAQAALNHPDRNYLGVEVHGPGVGHLMLRLAAQESRNVRILQADAMELLRRHLPAGALAEVLLFFPDPWPKQRHHKRRIVQPEFTRLVHRALKSGGLLHMATDWQDYARQMLAVLTVTEGMENLAGPGNYAPRPQSRPLTRFERRGQRLGHGVWDLLFTRSD
ncbi:MAG: tRNA (guanosine(46)-N7)-methyltransferase TrmB [Chromatiales bacterium]